MALTTQEIIVLTSMNSALVMAISRSRSRGDENHSMTRLVLCFLIKSSFISLLFLQTLHAAYRIGNERSKIRTHGSTNGIPLFITCSGSHRLVAVAPWCNDSI